MCRGHVQRGGQVSQRTVRIGRQRLPGVVDQSATGAGRCRSTGLHPCGVDLFEPYGGLGDLLATAATPGWTSADEVTIAYGLSSWRPTRGTLAAGKVSRQRREGRRIAYRNGRLELRTDDAPIDEWRFPAPLGTQKVQADFTMADCVTIPRHLATPAMRSYMTISAADDVSDPDPSPPVAVDESGRSSQTFLVDVVVRSGTTERRAVAGGRDIYAISAPLVVEATERVLGGLVERTGTLTAGQAFDARDFLGSLPLDQLSLP